MTSNPSGHKIVKQLLAKYGPMSNHQLYEFIPKYKDQLVSKHHLKQKILLPLQTQKVLYKKAAKPTEVPASQTAESTSPAKNAPAKNVWLWRFHDESLIEKYKQDLK